MAIAAVGEIVFALARTNCGESVRDCCDEGIERSGGRLSQQSFQLGEELLDRVEIGAVGRQIAQFGAGRFDRLLDAGDLVAGEIVHHDDVAGAERWNQTLLHIGAEARAIDRAVEHTWRGDLVDPQGRNERRRLPMAPWHAGDEALAPRAAAITTCHVGRRTRFVDEDQAFRVQLALAGTPFFAGCGDIRSILLGGSLRLFLSGSSRNCSLFHRHPMLTLT